MKQETKDLIKWIKKEIDFCGDFIASQSKVRWNEDAQKAMNFLDSLPEIESKLCQGGYIQDGNGVPCCNGDKITQDGITGNLYWSKQDFCFYFKVSDTLYSLYSNFRKVE